MQAVQFENTQVFWAFLLLLPLVGIFIWYLYKRKKNMRHYAKREYWQQLAPAAPKHKLQVKFLLLCLALVFGILGAANLQFGTKMREVEQAGIDVMLAIDLSRSMDAEDVAPSRMKKAQLFAKTLVQTLKGDRVGLIVFAGNAYLQCPLTTDYAAADMYISSLSTDVMPTQGTAIGQAIEVAQKAFPQEGDQGKVLIIISDGENHDQEALEKAEESGIIIHTVGVGTSKGSPVPVINNMGQRDFQRDQNGHIITSKLHERMLSHLASVGDGDYFRLDNASRTAKQVQTQFLGLKKVQRETQVFTDYEDRYQYFFGLCLFLLVCEMLVSERRSNWLWKRKWFS